MVKQPVKKSTSVIPARWTKPTPVNIAGSAQPTVYTSANPRSRTLNTTVIPAAGYQLAEAFFANLDNLKADKQGYLAFDVKKDFPPHLHPVK